MLTSALISGLWLVLAQTAATGIRRRDANGIGVHRAVSVICAQDDRDLAALDLVVNPQALERIAIDADSDRRLRLIDGHRSQQPPRSRRSVVDFVVGIGRVAGVRSPGRRDLDPASE